MRRSLSFEADKRDFWMRLPSGSLLYWGVCFLFFKIAGAFDFTRFWPHYYSAKNGTGWFSITGLSTVIAFMLFAIATNVASLQMLDKNENDFRKQRKLLSALIVITAAILPILGQVMIKAEKAKEIDAILQLAADLGEKPSAITHLRIQYYSDFPGKNGAQAEAIIQNARDALKEKIKEVR